MLKGIQFNSVFSLAIIDHTLYSIEVLTTPTGSNTMLKYIALLLMVLPTHLLAGSKEAVIQSIKDKYQGYCVEAQKEFRDIDYDEDDPVIADLSLSSESIYEIHINNDGKKATVLYADFRCTNIGSGWCGSSGCTSYVIVDGVPFQTAGFKPKSVALISQREHAPPDGGTTIAVIIPRSGGACVTAEGTSPSNDRACYSLAVWDDEAKTFNSMGSGEAVFRMAK